MINHLWPRRAKTQNQTADTGDDHASAAFGTPPFGSYPITWTTATNHLEPMPTIEVNPEEVPESNEILRGFRSFSVKLDQETGELELVGTYGHRWWQGTLKAECRPYGGNTLSDPRECLANPPISTYRHGDNGCGIYSVKSPVDRALFPALNEWIVFAQCVNWGVVHEGETGFRAENTTIEKIWLIVDKGARDGAMPKLYAMELERRFDAPCTVATFQDYCAEFGKEYEEVSPWAALVPTYAQSAFQSQQGLQGLLQSLQAYSLISQSMFFPNVNQSP